MPEMTVPATAARERGIGRRTARSVALLVWLGASGVQLAVWVLICAIGQRLASPWWLWTVGLGGLVVAVLWWLTQPRADDEPHARAPRARKPRGEESQPW